MAPILEDSDYKLDSVRLSKGPRSGPKKLWWVAFTTPNPDVPRIEASALATTETGAVCAALQALKSSSLVTVEVE